MLNQLNFTQHIYSAMVNIDNDVIAIHWDISLSASVYQVNTDTHIYKTYLETKVIVAIYKIYLDEEINC